MIWTRGLIIETLTGVGIEDLPVPLLGELGRAYNNNDKPEEAIKVLNSIDEEYRDAVYYHCASPMALLEHIIMRFIHPIICNIC